MLAPKELSDVHPLGKVSLASPLTPSFRAEPARIDSVVFNDIRVEETQQKY